MKMKLKLKLKNPSNGFQFHNYRLLVHLASARSKTGHQFTCLPMLIWLDFNTTGLESLRAENLGSTLLIIIATLLWFGSNLSANISSQPLSLPLGFCLGIWPRKQYSLSVAKTTITAAAAA